MGSRLATKFILLLMWMIPLYVKYIVFAVLHTALHLLLGMVTVQQYHLCMFGPGLLVLGCSSPFFASPVFVVAVPCVRHFPGVFYFFTYN